MVNFSNNFLWISLASDQYTIENYIKQEISRIKEVKDISCNKKGNFLNIWVIIDHLDRKVREKIYEIELKLLKRFTDFNFDFHVTF